VFREQLKQRGWRPSGSALRAATNPASVADLWHCWLRQ